MAPLSAPHIPLVRANPLLNPEAILGMKSPSIPCASATAEKTLSAQ